MESNSLLLCADKAINVTMTPTPMDIRALFNLNVIRSSFLLAINGRWKKQSKNSDTEIVSMTS